MVLPEKGGERLGRRSRSVFCSPGLVLACAEAPLPGSLHPMLFAPFAALFLLVVAPWALLDQVAGPGAPMRAGAAPLGEGEIPEARPVPGKAGFCFNPFTNDLVDVRGLPPGTLVVDPADPVKGRMFRVPRDRR